MNDIAIGQYIPKNSWLHKLNPVVKIIALIILLVTTFLIPISSDILNIIIMTSLLAFSFILVITSKIPITKVLRSLRTIVFLVVFTTLIQLFYVRDGNLILDLNMNISVTSIIIMILIVVFYLFTKKYIPLKIVYFLVMIVSLFVVQFYFPQLKLMTYELKIFDKGILKSLFLFMRIVNVIIISSLLTFTTMTTDISYGIEKLLFPFKWFLPVGEIAMMLSLTLRNIPTLLDETRKISKAQASRGVDFKESSITKKVSQVISLMIPILVISFKRANDLGDAMETRGYIIGASRTRVDYFKIKVSDIISIISVMLMLISIILFRVLI